MPYTPQTWDDDNALYPASATRFAHMETGIQTAQATAEAAGTSSAKNYLDVTTSPYNCIGDGEEVTDGAIANGSPTLTTAAAVRMKVGQKVYVIGAGASGAVLNTSVLTLLSSTQVTLTNNASTTIASGGTVVFGTDNRAGIMSAHTAGRPLFFPASSGKFYLVDIGTTSANTLTFTGSYMRWIGESREQSVIRMGPEGSASTFAIMIAVGSAQTWDFDTLTLQGPTNIGGGGPPSDPGTTGPKQNGVVLNGTSGFSHFINCRTRRFTTCVQVNATTTTAGYEMYGCIIEGYGSTWKSIGVGAQDGGASAYGQTKRVKLIGCEFYNFGDSAGANHYHAIYVNTAFDLTVIGCNFHTPSPTNTGKCIQHYDSAVGTTNNAQTSEIVDCTFGTNLAATTGITTAYSMVTRVIGNTFRNITQTSVQLNGPAIIVGNVFGAASSLASGIIQTQSQDLAGLPIGARITSNRFRGTATGGGAACVDIAHSSASSDFSIHGNTFEGWTNSSTYYVLIFGGSTVIGGRLSFTDNTVYDGPNAVVAADSSSTAMKYTVNRNRFNTASGCKLFKNATTAAAELHFRNNECNNPTKADCFQFTVTPVLVDVDRSNYGVGFPMRSTVGDANYTVLPQDQVVVTNATLTAARSYTLPAANAVPEGHEIRIKDEQGGATGTNTITVSRASTDTVEGATTAVAINAARGVAAYYSNGSNAWHKVG